MAWSGSWNSDRTVFTGMYIAPDGSIFAGTWTISARNSSSLDPADPPTPMAPPLSSYDPYTHGIGPRVDDAHSTRRPR
jgi:hypothetical protein